MDQLSNIKIPPNLTAGMQAITRNINTGHHYWCHDTIKFKHLSRFSQKLLGIYPISRNSNGRYYDRNRGLASVHFIVLPGQKNIVYWYLMSSVGKGGLDDDKINHVGMIYDSLRAGQHLTLRQYEALRMNKKDKSGKNKVTSTWRLQKRAYEEYKASIVWLAKHHQLGELSSLMKRLNQLPLHAGVRSQVFNLNREAMKVWCKFNKTNCSKLQVPSMLPVLPFINSYQSAPFTLQDLIERPEDWRLHEFIKRSW